MVTTGAGNPVELECSAMWASVALQGSRVHLKARGLKGGRGGSGENAALSPRGWTGAMFEWKPQPPLTFIGRTGSSDRRRVVATF
jgi:hypothetical protein